MVKTTEVLLVLMLVLAFTGCATIQEAACDTFGIGCPEEAPVQ